MSWLFVIRGAIRFWYVIIIAGLLAFNYIQGYRIGRLQVALAERNYVIHQMQLESEAQEERTKAAEKASQKVAEKSNERLQEIMNDPVSDQCNEAIVWLVELSKTEKLK